MSKKNILLIHQGFPGQFGYLAPMLAKDGHQVVALTLNPSPEIPGVKVLPYRLLRRPIHNLPYLLQEQDVKTLRAESVAATCEDLRAKGFTPDVVYVHPGWGEALYIKTIWPDTRLVMYGEWYYNLTGQEIDFDTEFEPLSFEEKQRLKLKNTVLLHALNDADAIICPTHWQKSRFPAWAQSKIEVVHDGINLAVLKPNPRQNIQMPEKKLTLDRNSTVITFAARYLEPVRGFHTFMRCLPVIQEEFPEAQVVVMGRDAGDAPRGYGRTNPQGKTWRQSLLEELKGQLDLDRIHFLGFQNHPAYLAALQISTCHVYLTWPFVLSWSFLEAAALGVPIVASRTAPVEEFAQLSNLHLCDFHDSDAIIDNIMNILDGRPAHTPNTLPDIDLLQTLKRQKAILLDHKPASAPARPTASTQTAEPQETVIIQAEPEPLDTAPSDFAAPASGPRAKPARPQPRRFTRGGRRQR